MRAIWLTLILTTGCAEMPICLETAVIPTTDTIRTRMPNGWVVEEQREYMRTRCVRWEEE